MQQPDPREVIETYDHLFGYGWRKLYAEAIGIRSQTLSPLKSGATLQHAVALAEFFETTPPRHWPERFDKLRRKRQEKIKRENERTETA